MAVREKLGKRASKAGLTLPDSLTDSLTSYFQLLQKWNRKISLTSLPVEHAGDEAIDRLLLEPVVAAKFLPKGEVAALDIGSGGGSPAIPLKLAAQGLSLRMVESRTRKAAFLREIVRSLRLRDAQIFAVRVEELLAQPKLHDAFHVVTMRAVRIDRKMVGTIHPLLRPAGLLFLFGSVSPQSDQGAHLLVPVASHILLSEWGSRLDIYQKQPST